MELTTKAFADMATFPTPDRALAAALHIRDAMGALNAQHQNEDLLLKIGLHEGPCRLQLIL